MAEEYSEKLFENKSRLHGALFNDVFMRFYHQLSNQGAVVLKEFFADRKAFSASIADAIVEALMQRCPDLDDSFMEKVLDVFGKSRWYKELIDSTDAFFDIKKVIELLNMMTWDAVEVVPKEVMENLGDTDSVQLRFDGRYEPMFMEPENPPLGVPIEVKPVL